MFNNFGMLQPMIKPMTSCSPERTLYWATGARALVKKLCTIMILSFRTDRSGQTGSTVFDIPSASFGCITTWVRSCENMSYAICKQQRSRSACASAQSDQHLCCSLLRSIDSMICILAISKVSRLYLVSIAEHAGLSLTCSKIPEDMFSRDMAQTVFVVWLQQFLGRPNFFRIFMVLLLLS